MKLSIVIAALTTASCWAFDENTGKYGEIDTRRPPRIFDPPKARRPGYTYVDELKIDIDAEMDTMGMELKGTFDATGDMKTTVTAQSGGSVKIDIVIENVKADLASPLMNFACDSNKREANPDPSCTDLYTVVGAEESMLLDSNGNLLELTTIDGQTFNVAATQQQSLQDKFKANQLSASQHLDKSKQLLELIPDHAVRPGDTWIDDVTFDDYGNFKGTSQLVGYTNYQGADCALFRFDGTLHLDVTIIGRAVGLGPEQLPQNLQDTIVTNEILYDINDDIIRWAEVNLTTSFDIANPMAPNQDENSAHIPVEVRLSMATDIIARPDHEEEASSSSSSSYKAYAPGKSSSSESKSGGGGGGGGAFKGIFFALLVGAVAAAGFMFYKKQQQSWEFVRPSYSFSPVAAEPIYNYESPPIV